MKAEKESFIIYKEWNSLIESLDDENRLIFYDVLFNFEGEEIPTYQNKHLQAVVNFVFSRVIENNNKYKEKKEINSQNSKKRWDKVAMQNMRSDAVVQSAMLNDNDNDNVNDNGNDNVNVNVKDKSKSAKAPSFKSYTNKDLINEMKPLIDKYGKDTCNAFYSYWSEPLANGKMRMTNEKAWDTIRRLATWKQREKQPNSNFIKQVTPVFNRSSQGQKYIGDDVV